MDEHEDRLGSFEQPAGPVSSPSRASRAPGVLAGIGVVAALSIAVAVSALGAGAPARPETGPGIVADASASAGSSAKPERAKPERAKRERPRRERGEPVGRMGRIEIATIDRNRISLRTEDGWTRTITVTADTEITRGGESAAVGDLQVGDVVNLRQRRNDDGTFTVIRIAVPAPRLAGVVTAVDGDTVTVTARRGDRVTITVDATTTYLVGRDAGTKADLTVGSRIAARGALDDGRGFRATEIRIAPPLVTGTVTAVDGSTLTVTERDGSTVTVHIASGAQIRVRGKGRDASVADIVVGSRVAATGRLRADGSMDASVVLAGRGGSARPGASPVAPSS